MHTRYDPLHPDLLEARHRARCLAHKFNNVDPNTGSFEQVAEAKTQMLTEIFGRVGRGTFIEAPLYPDYGCNTIIGENCFINFKCAFSLSSSAPRY